MTSRIGFGRTLALPFDEAVTRVTDALRKEGFGRYRGKVANSRAARR
jgi:hypothetical protein